MIRLPALAVAIACAAGCSLVIDSSEFQGGGAGPRDAGDSGTMDDGGGPADAPTDGGPGPCSDDDECTDPAAPFCAEGRCARTPCGACADGEVCEFTGRACVAAGSCSDCDGDKSEGGDDCNDADARIWPGAPPVCGLPGPEHCGMAYGDPGELDTMRAATGSEEIGVFKPVSIATTTRDPDLAVAAGGIDRSDGRWDGYVVFTEPGGSEVWFRPYSLAREYGDAVAVLAGTGEMSRSVAASPDGARIAVNLMDGWMALSPTAGGFVSDHERFLNGLLTDGAVLGEEAEHEVVFAQLRGFRSWPPEDFTGTPADLEADPGFRMDTEGTFVVAPTSDPARLVFWNGDPVSGPGLVTLGGMLTAAPAIAVTAEGNALVLAPTAAGVEYHEGECVATGCGAFTDFGMAGFAAGAGSHLRADSTAGGAILVHRGEERQLRTFLFEPAGASPSIALVSAEQVPEGMFIGAVESAGAISPEGDTDIVVVASVVTGSTATATVVVTGLRLCAPRR